MTYCNLHNEAEAEIREPPAKHSCMAGVNAGTPNFEGLRVLIMDITKTSLEPGWVPMGSIAEC
jgi:hypothetical protein